MTDANGCTGSAEVWITQPSNGLSASVSGSDVSCFGGSDGAVQVRAIVGTGPYTYMWSTGAESADVWGLAAGMYSVTGSDCLCRCWLCVCVRCLSVSLHMRLQA